MFWFGERERVEKCLLGCVDDFICWEIECSMRIGKSDYFWEFMVLNVCVCVCGGGGGGEGKYP